MSRNLHKVLFKQKVKVRSYVFVKSILSEINVSRSKKERELFTYPGYNINENKMETLFNCVGKNQL